MAISRRDWASLGLLAVVLLVAALGRTRLRVDVENLAMKAVGSHAARAAAEREREFGHAPRVLLLATPRAPETLHPIDEREVTQWIEALRERPEVAALEAREGEAPGVRILGVTIRTDSEGRYADAVKALERVARRTVPATYGLAVAGVPVTEIEIAGAMRAERTRILPILGIVLAGALLLLHRNAVLAFGTLVAPLAGVLFVEGLQGLVGWPVDPVSGLLGPAVLTVGVASSVHVVERYRQHVVRGRAPAAAAASAARELRRPLLLTVATTVAGFLGLLTSPIPAVRRFGVLASAGVGFAVLATLVFLPVLLGSLHRPGDGATTCRWRGLALPGLRRGRTVVWLALLASLAGAWSMADQRSDSDPLRILSPENRVRRDASLVGERLGGSEVFELLVPPREGAAPDVFAQLGLVARIAALRDVVGPAGRPLVSENGYGLLTFLIAPGGSAEREELFASAERLARDAGFEGARATGLAVRVARDSEELLTSRRRGMGLTLLVLWAVMSLGFRSVPLGLLGLIPNVLPVLLVQGTMAAAGRPVSVASSMIAIVMLGLVVDDTIHLLHEFRSGRGSALRRVARALRTVTRPIALTTLVLCLGFSATILGELAPTREFGALAVATLVVALIADLWLLPALLLWRRSERSRIATEPLPCPEPPATTS